MTDIARKLGLPRRLVTILEGESLFNDATALVLYAAAVSAATGGHFSLGATLLSIIYSTSVGGAIGMGVGIAGRLAARWVDDPSLEIAGSILLAYTAYLPALALHASGVLAAVVAGLYLGRHRSDTLSVTSRLRSGAFWETLTFLLNAALFVLVGLSLHTFSTSTSGPLGRLILTGTGVVAAVILIRLAWMNAGSWLTTPDRRAAATESPKWRDQLILGWSGIRGAITLAALLAVPELNDNNQPLAGRADIIYLGYAVVIVTLLAQGMTLPHLIGRLRPLEHPAVIRSERRARIELAQATVNHLESTLQDVAIPEELGDGLMAQYVARLGRLKAGSSGPITKDPIPEVELELRRDLNAFQRRTLLTLRREGRIGTSALRAIEHDLDLEEAHLATG